MSRQFFGGSYNRDRGWKWGWQNLEEAMGLGYAFPKYGRFFDNGEVRLVILSLLEDGPKHGYQLMKEMQERSGGIYRASAGTVYPTLQQLEDEGLIDSEKKDGRRVYSLTEAGRTELARDPEAVKRIWERAESWGDWAEHLSGKTLLIMAGSIKKLTKSALRAAHWAEGNERRQEQVKKILRRAAEDLDDLTEEK
ncbi:MAG TPA: helix-turn-helix transcriptional regulator [Bryobacteraceae bacterium]|nr:helix-turn-helix transcriptional regulator [Bryobacteraceae bacterium]